MASPIACQDKFVLPELAVSTDLSRVALPCSNQTSPALWLKLAPLPGIGHTINITMLRVSKGDAVLVSKVEKKKYPPD